MFLDALPREAKSVGGIEASFWSFLFAYGHEERDGGQKTLYINTQWRRLVGVLVTPGLAKLYHWQVD